MSITERMAAIHINPAAANNRADGSSLANAWRDAEELTRRLGRGTAWFRQPTTVTIHGALSAGDYLNVQAAVGAAGNLKLLGNRGAAVASGTFSAKTDFVVASQAQQVTGPGLGSHVGKQIIITASGTPSHVNAVARIAKSVSGDNVRTTPFAVPTTNGTLPSNGVTSAILPSVGDTFAVYALPTVPVGKVLIVPASNVNSNSAGTGFGFALFQDLILRGDASGTNYASSIASEAWRSAFVGCDLDFIAVVGHESQSAFQACKLDGVWLAGGASVHYYALQKDTGSGTQLIRAHYGDFHYVLGQGGPATFSGALPFSYAGSTLILFNAEAYDSVASGLFVNDNSHTWIERHLWGSGHAEYGVQISKGARLFTRPTGVQSITGALGEIDVLSPDTEGGHAVHTWAEGFFSDAYGAGVIRG